MALDLFNPWSSDLETDTNAFFPGHHEDMSFFFFFEKKCLGSYGSSDRLWMSVGQCLRRGGGFWQFVEHHLRMEQKSRAGWFSMWWGALVSVWFRLFRRKISAQRQVRGQRLPPDYRDDWPALLLFLVVKPAGFWWREQKMTGVLYMWCLPCLSYVDSACNLLGLFCVCLVWDVAVEDPERKWHNGTGGLHGTTMNVATLPELFAYSLERERERERERESRHQKKSTWLRRLCPQQERFFCKQNVRMRSSSRTCACMHARLEGALDPPVQCAPTGTGTGKSTGDRDSAPLSNHFQHSS